MNRLEQVCHAIEHGEWPAAKRYRLLPESDSRSSTPAASGTAPGTPDHYMTLDSSASTVVSPSSRPSFVPFSFAGASGGVGDGAALLRMMGAGEGEGAGSGNFEVNHWVAEQAACNLPDPPCMPPSP